MQASADHLRLFSPVGIQDSYGKGGYVLDGVGYVGMGDREVLLSQKRVDDKGNERLFV